MEQEEPVLLARRVACVQGRDPLDGRGDPCLLAGQGLGVRIREVREQREVDGGVQVAERLHLEVLDECACAGDRVQERRDDHHGARAFRDPRAQVEPWQQPWGHEAMDDVLQQRRGQFAGGQQDHEPGRERVPGRGGVGERPCHGAGAAQQRECAERAQVDRRGVLVQQPARRLAQRRPMCDVGLERRAPRSDQVIPDVRGTRVRAGGLGGLARTFDGAQRHADLRLAVRVGDLLDGVPVAIAAREVHAPVDARRVAAQDLLHTARVLDVLVPVQRRTQPQAGERVAHRDVVHRLALVLGAHGVLDGRARVGEHGFEAAAQLGCARTVLAHAPQELVHERHMHRVRQRRGARATRPAFEGREHLVRGLAAGPALEQLLRQPAQVLDERELEQARPGPQFADAQRRDRLERVHEPFEPRPVEPGVAVAQHLDRHRVHAHGARACAHGELGQLEVVARRQVALDLAELAFDEMEVVEQPVGRRCAGLTQARVAGELAVRAPQDASVLGQLVEELGRSATGLTCERELGGQCARALLEPVHAQQLAVQRTVVESRGPAATHRWHAGDDAREAVIDGGHEPAALPARATGESMAAMEGCAPILAGCCSGQRSQAQDVRERPGLNVA